MEEIFWLSMYIIFFFTCFRKLQSVKIFRFPVGSHVVGAFIMPCGNCFFCVKVENFSFYACVVFDGFSLSCWVLVSPE